MPGSLCLLSSVAGWMEFLKQLKFKNKKAAAFGCYGWSGESAKQLSALLAEAGFNVVDEGIRTMWVPDEAALAACEEYGRAFIGKLS